MRETAVAAIGIGALTALLIMLSHRSGALTIAEGVGAHKPFAAGLLVGCIVASLAAGLYYAKGGYAPLGRGAAPAVRATVGCALAIAGLATCTVGIPTLLWGPEVLGIAWSAGGVCAGLGCVLLALPLGAYSPAQSTSMGRALFVLGIACLVTAALDSLSRILAPAGTLPLGVAEALVAAACPYLLAAGGAHPSRGELAVPAAASASAAVPADTARDTAGDTQLRNAATFSHRIAQAARQSWKPAVGAVICAFIFGFTWDTDTLGVQLNAVPSLVVEKIVGCCIAGAFLLALSRYRGTRDVQAVLFGALLPVMVVTFILRPYFLSLSLGPTALTLFGVARETGFALFMAATLLAVSRAARDNDVPGEFMVAVCAGACALAALLGLYWLHALGAVANYVGAVLFTLYLIVTVVTGGLTSPSSRGETGGEPAAGRQLDAQPLDPQQLLDRALEARCDLLVERYALTPRERDILLHLGRGHSYAYIANALTVSENTVRTHVRNLYRKMGVSSREELLAILHGE